MNSKWSTMKDLSVALGKKTRARPELALQGSPFPGGECTMRHAEARGWSEGLAPRQLRERPGVSGRRVLEGRFGQRLRGLRILQPFRVCIV